MTPSRGGQSCCVFHKVLADVVVHQHVLACHKNALEATNEDLDFLGRSVGGATGAGAADQHGLGLQDGIAKDFHTGSLEGVACFNDVGNGIRHAEAHGRLHGSVQADHLGVDASLGEVVAQKSVIAGGQALAFKLLDAGEVTYGTSKPERGRGGEAQGEAVLRLPPWRQARGRGQ